MGHVTVVGAGGIGCAVGYALCAEGVRVHFVDANTAKVAWGQSNGVAVDGRPARPASFQLFSNWSPAPDSTILLCTKCYDNPAILARLPASSTFIPIQNGFDPLIEDRGTPLEGIASFVSECAPGKTHTRITRQGRLHIGGRAGADGWQGSRVIEALRRTKLFRVEVVADILPFKYSKLMYNAAISPLAAAAGIDNGQLLSVPPARRLFFALLRENYQILRAAGIRLGRIGPFHPDSVQQILRQPAVARMLSWAFYPTLRGTYCSMSGDLPKGITEIDFYNRHLIELAKDEPCPMNRGIYELVKRMERERIPPSREVLDQLERACVQDRFAASCRNHSS